ncbi:MAG: SDR family NAD(P)-dependent oxidoreductase [Chloroflexi bacterium]|nr:MAG: SDR family NAD(P)-dependent oxidoreductase [Chloroflexota bacterium]
MELKNKVALITGAAVRVGRVAALELAKKGVHIAFTYLNDEEPWQETLAKIEAKGVKGTALPLDVRQHEQPKEVVEKVIEKYGRIDILINNASIWLSSPFLDISFEAWQASLDVNLTGPFLCAQAVAPHMLMQESGLIINITDLSAFQAWPNNAHHAASKAGLVALTKVMAVELAPHVRVNGIAPGTVLLPPNAREEKIQWAKENSLLKRVGSPQDVARTIIFLAEMEFATGAIYFMDGGRALI